MPRIRIIEVLQSQYECDGLLDYMYQVSPNGCTEWRDVEDEELAVLEKFIKKNNNSGRTSYKLVLLKEQIGAWKQPNIEYYMKQASDMELQEEKQRKIRKQAILTRKKNKEEKDKRKELEILEQLQNKYAKEIKNNAK